MGEENSPWVLLVEDSPVHQRLMVEGFRRAGSDLRLDTQPDAEGAWAVVERMRRMTPAQWPRFAIIDIGLPGASGIELVDRIRHEPELRNWPLVILTASSDPDDVAESFMALATAYFMKPTSPAAYTGLAREILLAVGSAASPPAPAKRVRRESEHKKSS